MPSPQTLLMVGLWVLTIAMLAFGAGATRIRHHLSGVLPSTEVRKAAAIVSLKSLAFMPSDLSKFSGETTAFIKQQCKLIRISALLIIVGIVIIGYAGWLIDAANKAGLQSLNIS